MTPRSTAIAAAIALTLTTGAVMAQTQNAPIPGIDVVVKKKPSGSALVVGTTGRGGQFSGTVRVERGEYQVTAACPPRRTCAPFRLASVRINGRALLPNARGEFVFPVGPTVRSVMMDANTAMAEVSTTR